MDLIRCPSCEGYGWHEDEFTGEIEDCTWCAGVGYVYRDAQGVDRKIPAADLKKSDVATQLEQLDQERLREMGYQGQAKKPWEQDIRKGTQGGIDPYADVDEDATE